ncbi:chemotaxis response regulator protein-glutamate methylesterase [Rapidithrix thailandica]|uniref:Protein-glutamate methylesterase/protein-glutamine glutaminase n=1 Tax=Rapidithrix thailandica TaxID=413964 RepID=A0AAW9S9H8_9BACT
MDPRVKVLIVDDSALFRQTLRTLLESESDIKVIGTAMDPYFAAQKITREKPDVITLDIEMPRMDGLTFLKKLMKQAPIPVVIITSLTQRGTALALKAIELGAVEVITKPQMDSKKLLEESRIKITDTIRSAAMAKLKEARVRKTVQTASAKRTFSPVKRPTTLITHNKVVAVGASTGGTDALKLFLQSLDEHSPGVVIVQHMPEKFTKSFADRLNEICRISVKEAENDDQVLPGTALIAPGNFHMSLFRIGNQYKVKIFAGELVNRHRPAVDVLFKSVAHHAGPNAIGVIMTGMGSDGAQGLWEMREAGAYTIAQDEKSCVVFGMPKKAIEKGAACTVLPLEQIAEDVLIQVNQEEVRD